jgi:hypothetical protein
MLILYGISASISIMQLDVLAHAVEYIKTRFRRTEMNFNEARVPNYSLPDPLLHSNGDSIDEPLSWLKGRRSEILQLFEDHVYGIDPRESWQIEFHEVRCESGVFQGQATLKEIDISLRNHPAGLAIHLILFIPKVAAKPVPVILGLNFLGNHTIHPDPHISIHKQWQIASRYSSPRQVLPPFSTRGADHRRWPIETLLERGYAVATAYYGDFEPDFPGGWRYGIRSILPAGSAGSRPNDWGAIAVWAWGMSRILDGLSHEPDIDPTRVLLTGHSRLGKAVLWAGARDDRFAIVMANDSGCGGAALYRRRYGETIKLLNRVRPHWFCQNFKRYDDREDELPVDQHMLVGLLAPRPVYIASASEDLAADPRGEFLAAREAGRIYELFGLTGLGVEELPGLNEPVGATIGYHIRSGPHDMTDYDWQQFIRFADRHFGRNATR